MPFPWIEVLLMQKNLSVFFSVGGSNFQNFVYPFWFHLRTNSFYSISWSHFEPNIFLSHSDNAFKAGLLNSNNIPCRPPESLKLLMWWGHKIHFDVYIKAKVWFTAKYRAENSPFIPSVNMINNLFNLIDHIMRLPKKMWQKSNNNQFSLKYFQFICRKKVLLLT